MAKRDNERAARILAEAQLTGNDLQVVERHEISLRTLYNYRAALAEDRELSTLFMNLLRAAETQSWLSQLDKTMLALLKKITGGLELVSPEDIGDLARLAEIMDTLAEIRLSRDMYGVDEKGESEERARAAGAARREGEGAAPSGLN